MQLRRGFASDNNSGVHPEILKAVSSVNQGHVIGYGDDPYTQKAIDRLKKLFDHEIDAYFVFGGTGANVFALKCLTEPFNSIICPRSAHINMDECNAPEIFTGCKLIPVDAPDGKLTVDLIDKYIHNTGDAHHAVPKVVSISQATEVGTVYTPDEIRKIADFAHNNGARISNAVEYLGVTLKQLTLDSGVDAFSFGGTKNGLMFGEAVIFFDKKLSINKAKYFRQQTTQLASKMRFIAAQFEAYLADDLWIKNAKHANEMAHDLYMQIKDIPNVFVTQKVQSNAVFAKIPKNHIKALQDKCFFYVWDEQTGEIRWMTSYDTTREDIEDFVKYIRQIVPN